MKLIVGLGNCSEEYDTTRHNIGFKAVDYLHEFSGVFEPWTDNKKMLCYGFSIGEIFNKKCVLVKPNTYMNLSGNCVIKIMNYYKISSNDLIVIHDDADFDFGIIKTSQSRNAAGHNGVKSINSVVIGDYTRIRVGIGRPDENKFDIANYVLSKFTTSERREMDNIFANVAKLVEDIVKNN
jgi:PTH1 family peptidyl-tRNA hydrolase